LRTAIVGKYYHIFNKATGELLTIDKVVPSKSVEWLNFLVFGPVRADEEKSAYFITEADSDK
jgi:hypothetical protein